MTLHGKVSLPGGRSDRRCALSLHPRGRWHGAAVTEGAKEERISSVLSIRSRRTLPALRHSSTRSAGAPSRRELRVASIPAGGGIAKNSKVGKTVKAAPRGAPLSDCIGGYAIAPNRIGATEGLCCAARGTARRSLTLRKRGRWGIAPPARLPLSFYRGSRAAAFPPARTAPPAEGRLSSCRTGSWR